MTSEELSIIKEYILAIKENTELLKEFTKQLSHSESAIIEQNKEKKQKERITSIMSKNALDAK